MINPANATLNQRSKTFEHIYMRIAFKVDLRGMMNALMLKAYASQRIVGRSFIGVDGRTGHNAFDHMRQQRPLSHVWNHSRDYTSAAFERAPYWLFADRAATRAETFVAMLVYFLSADESFVGLNLSGQVADVLLKHERI